MIMMGRSRGLRGSWSRWSEVWDGFALTRLVQLDRMDNEFMTRLVLKE